MPDVHDSSHDDLRKHERTPVRLIVDYEDVDDFLGDYTENLSSGGTFIHTGRVFAIGTSIQLVLSFPGLVQPIALEGVVRWARGLPRPGIGVEFLAGPSEVKLAALVDRVRHGDPFTVAHVVKVLVVEDNPHVCELICSGLSAATKRVFGDGLAFTFTVAVNGRAAMELLEAERFDAVIIDVYLPVVDGPQVIDFARSALGLVTLPIIAVSAGGEHARDAALAAGASTFIHKPMRLRQVIDTMRQLVKLSA
jgi:uncharacterized protein (TIGR02266 family)